MQIFMMTLGTRGDLELFLMLGRELHQRGHRITLGTSSFYSTRVHDAGLDWAQVGNGTQDELIAILRSQASVSDKRARITAYAREQGLHVRIITNGHRLAVTTFADGFACHRLQRLLNEWHTHSVSISDNRGMHPPIDEFKRVDQKFSYQQHRGRRPILRLFILRGRSGDYQLPEFSERNRCDFSQIL